MAPPRVVVLVSGSGTNLQALLDAVAEGRLCCEIAAVVSNRPDARGLERAKRAQVAALVVETVDGESRVDYDTRLASAVREFEPDLVVLAGFMRVLSSLFLDHFEVINLHPALPGTFVGTRSIERAFDQWQAGEIERSGVMVHWVPDEGVDNGPVIASAEVRFVDGDTLAAFEARMHEAEHELIVSAVHHVLAERTSTTTRSDPREPQREAFV